MMDQLFDIENVFEIAIINEEELNIAENVTLDNNFFENEDISSLLLEQPLFESLLLEDSVNNDKNSELIPRVGKSLNDPKGTSIYHVVRGGGGFQKFPRGELIFCAIYFVLDQNMVALILHLSSYKSFFGIVMYGARNLEMSIRFSLKSRPSERFHWPEMSQIKAEISLHSNVKLNFHKNLGWQGYQWIP